MKHSETPDVDVPRDVFVQWAQWIDAGQPERVRADLTELLAAVPKSVTVDRPDPPSSVDPPISTR